jgi:ribosomal protein L21E
VYQGTGVKLHKKEIEGGYMILTKGPQKFKEGHYGHVFFTDEGMAVKVFKKHHDMTEDFVTKVYTHEAEAYVLAISNNLPVPKYYGPQMITSILDGSGKDISSNYYLELNFGMSKVEGNFQKTGVRDEGLAKAFRSCGIRHINDASVKYSPIGTVECVIDFATQEDIPEW